MDKISSIKKMFPLYNYIMFFLYMRPFWFDNTNYSCMVKIFGTTREIDLYILMFEIRLKLDISFSQQLHHPTKYCLLSILVLNNLLCVCVFAVLCVFYGVCCIMCVALCVLYYVCCVMCVVLCVLYGVCCIMCVVLCVLYYVCCIMCVVLCVHGCVVLCVLYYVCRVVMY